MMKTGQIRDRRRMRRRRGTALVEMAMAIPLLATIIGLTFFFGWAMKNQLQVQTSSRYAAWRRVRTSGGVSRQHINALFFDERAENIDITSSAGPQATLQDLADEAGGMSARAHMLAEDTVVGGWPRGQAIEVAAGFPSDIDLWARFGGRIKSYHAREGHQWQRSGQVSYLRTIRERFLYDLDAAVSRIDDTTLRDNLRELYEKRW